MTHLPDLRGGVLLDTKKEAETERAVCSTLVMGWTCEWDIQMDTVLILVSDA